MSDEQPAVAPVQPDLTEAQLADFAALLAKTVARGNIAWLATSVLGSDALHEAANEVGDVPVFARRVVDALDKAGRIPDAVALLRQEAHRNSYLSFGLNHILRGKRLDDHEATQAFVNEYEPFLSSAAFQERFPRVMRTVCAIGLDSPIKKIVGSGFLIGSDLVMTNYHVLETFLKEAPDGTIQANGPGDKIFCFFDYLWEPAPKVPPSDETRHVSLAVQAADDWLVHARKMLDFDGTDQSPLTVDKEYDYAVIRLRRHVGRLPARLSGGAVRGWLPLPEKVGALGNEPKRIIVFQHPGTAPQQFDIGDFDRLDRSGTRVWYSVSTAKGSSGGAAVDSDGRLFALHNAEVQIAAVGPRRLNQGVRIDLIAEDLARLPDWQAAPAPEEDSLAFWSLNDDPREPQPIVGRTKFRENVHAMTAENGERLMVVTGSPGSGRRFSIQLLRRTLGPQTPVVIFSPKDLQTLSPKNFLKVLAEEMGFLGLAEKPIPDPQSTEGIPRWLRVDLPRWLLERLTEDQARNRARYPAWIVINTILDDPAERLFWADNLKDLVAALAGFHDPGQTIVDLPQLRWLFLGSKSETLPVRGVRPHDEDLSSDTSFQQDFANCLQLAWRSVDKQAPLAESLSMALAAFALESGAGKPPRKVLAELVRSLLLKAPSAGGQP